MTKEVKEINWNEILEKFNSYKGSVIDFCKENSITKGQFYYYKRRLKKIGKPVFHAIALNKKDTNAVSENYVPIASKDIKIEIGKANIYIPTNEIALISAILKELAKSC